MAADNLQIVLDAYVRDRENHGAWLEIVDPEVEWDTTRAMPDTAVVHGLESVRDFFREWRGVFDEADWEPRRTQAAGDVVVVEVHMYGRARKSGVVTDRVFAQVLTLRDGKVTRYVAVNSFDEGLAFAGLS